MIPAWLRIRIPSRKRPQNVERLLRVFPSAVFVVHESEREEYAAAANLVIHHPDTLHKIEKEDGDTCFYYEAANLFVVLSKDGYIRTFFAPDSGKKYYDKQ